MQINISIVSPFPYFYYYDYQPWYHETLEKQGQKQHIQTMFTWQYIVAFLGWLSDPLIG